MGFEYHNLIRGTRDGTGWFTVNGGTISSDDGMVVGTATETTDDDHILCSCPTSLKAGKYTLGVDVRVTENFLGGDAFAIATTSGNLVANFGLMIFRDTEWHHFAFTISLEKDVASAIVATYIGSTDGKQASIYLRDMMLVAGTTHAAWAPADGETLAGGVLS